MRTWGRIANPNVGQPGPPGPVDVPQPPFLWVQVTTDPTTGLNDMVYLTTLCQTLLLNLNESPFYSNRGIPQQQSVIQQVWPDYYVALTQQLFAPYFASLTVERETGAENPTYNVYVMTHQGLIINASIPVPT
jgi:hypothetical protein